MKIPTSLPLALSCGTLIFGISSLQAEETLAELVNQSSKAQSARFEQADGKNMRNSQNLAAVCSAARAAGHDFVGKETELAKIVSNIVKGATLSSGPFQGTFFGVPNLSEEDQLGTLAYLSIEHGALRFSSDTGTTKRALEGPKSTKQERSMAIARMISHEVSQLQKRGEDLVGQRKDVNSILAQLAARMFQQEELSDAALTLEDVARFLEVEAGHLKFSQNDRAAKSEPSMRPEVSKVAEAKQKRSAQSLASVCASAQAAGLDFVGKESDLMKVLAAIVKGETVKTGSFQGLRFAVGGLTEEDLAGASRYLSIKDGTLRYMPLDSHP